ncbi:MAG: urease accessory protein UreD [Pseudomonadota bacterium]
MYHNNEDLTKPPLTHPNWYASLELAFAKTAKGTRLCKNLHQGPLMVQKPFYPESSTVCHVYLLHPPGGVVQGDQLKLDVRVKSAAHALITTPAAGKFYRSNGKVAALSQVLEVEDAAQLEWLPQETLLFNASRVQLKTLVKLSGTARFIGWEMLCLGRKASDEPYTSGTCRQQFEIWRDNKPVFIERCLIAGDSALLTEKWGMDKWPLTATLIATNCGKAELKSVQELLSQLTENNSHTISIKGHLSVSLKQDILICRFLGEQAEHARHCFIEIWKLIRPVIMQQSVHIPRIWNT